MSEIKIKNPSALMEAVFALDGYYADLIRLGKKIESFELKSNFDFEQTQRHLEHFTDAAQGVSEKVVAMSKALMDVRAQAEAITEVVAERAEIVRARHDLHQTKMQAFAKLGAEVGELHQELLQLGALSTGDATDEDRDQLKARLEDSEPKLRALIEKAQAMRDDARESKIKELEQSADSLTQKLSSIGTKLFSKDF